MAPQLPRVEGGEVDVVFRKPAVLAATGWSNSTLYEKIEKGLFPKPFKLDPDDLNGRAVGWWGRQVKAHQERVAERAKGR